MIYKPKYFKLYELVPQDMYIIYKGSHRLWYLFDNRILVMIDSLRNKYGKMLANTWYWKGKHQYRGWRPQDSLVGAEFSQHKYGRAVDLIPLEYSIEEIRDDIKSKYLHHDFRFITCIENNVNWIHIDCRNWNKYKSGILII